MEAHRRLARDFAAELAAGPAAALAFATALMSRSLGRNDPGRADALECLARAHLAADRLADALPPALEALRIRRLAAPPQDELLGLSLMIAAPMLFAAGRFEEADASAAESLEAHRRAFGQSDVRLAEQCEWQARLVQGGFGRAEWVGELLAEAVAVREADTSSSRGKLAETLIGLATQETNACAYDDADRHLARADALLEAEVARPRADPVLRMLRVHALVLRSGLAGQRADHGEGERLAQAAAGIRFADRATRIEMRLLVLEALSTRRALAGDLAGAVAAQKKAVATLARHRDLTDGGSLDAGIEGDALLSLGKLQLRNDDVDAALTALDGARSRLGDSPAVLFAWAELAGRLGDEAQALKCYRAALRLRKESAAEVAVLFGTNRVQGDDGDASFGGELGETVRLGSAAVLVPGAQFSVTTQMRPGAPRPIAVGPATDAALLLIRRKRVLGSAAFAKTAAARMKAARLNGGAVLVFVHGFNVTFDQALQRAAQLARDLNFDGATAVFSWPSQGSMVRYGSDRKIADATVPRLVEFLSTLLAATGAERIHLVAHSMGNRVLLPALADVCRHPDNPVRARLGEVVLAAPAVPESEFRGLLDDIVAHGGARITLYASKVDWALRVGRWREWRTTLAGYSSAGVPLCHPGLQSIDITKGASGERFDLNHDVFASNPVMSEDIRQILQGGSMRPPDVRLPGLFARGICGQAPYWSYDPPLPNTPREPPRV